MINLISDTVTKPSKEMLEFMFKAEVGDDVFGEDPSVNDLEAYCARLFGKEKAIFCPSGTMTNQIAIKCHTQPLDEVICDHYSHVYQYETGGYAFNSGVAINLIEGVNGKITASQIESVIKPVYDWLPISKLVVLENSCNKGGGSYYTKAEIEPIAKLCKERNLKLHLDGARLFNVLVETGETPLEIGQLFDSVSICISKGLGAPVGSLLIGPDDMIRQARRYRKVMGGGMRQVGYLAAACKYALTKNIDRLKIDNDKARELGDLLNTLPFVDSVRPVKTNIVIFDLVDGLAADRFLHALKEKKVIGSAFGPKTVRFVTHLDYTDQMHDQVLTILENLNP
jgi:threonine aldolase